MLLKTNLYVKLFLFIISVAHSLPVPRQADVNHFNIPEKHRQDVINALANDKAEKDEPVEHSTKRVILEPPVDRGGDVDLNNEVFEHQTKLSADQLKPKDHMDAVKMEQDGHMNSQYHKEMFIGEKHDEFKEYTFQNAKDKLKEIVRKADLDRDGKLSHEELEKLVEKNMDEHFKEADDENDHIFKHLDPDGNGLVTWKEYYIHFLLSRGYNFEVASRYVKDYDDSIDLSQNDKDLLMSYKFRWSDAEEDPKDNRLKKHEFMLFRHPERSRKSLNLMAYNVMRGIDANNDSVITIDEFAALPAGEVEGEEFQEMDRKWVREKRAEFNNILDANRDGRATIHELTNYLDPSNHIQAKLEASFLLDSIDDNSDLYLSMKEIEKHMELFISSKVVNFAQNVHDEF